jgi:NADH dehydrogenase [ubiquinone] 1 alpha subcomplex assembly factor 5
MNPETTHPEIFDRKRRRALRERAGKRGGDAFLWNYIAQDLADRFAVVTREFEQVLIIGPIAHWHEKILPQGATAVVHAPLSKSEAIDGDAVAVEEDRLPYEPASFDLVISAGTLDSVNDLPGALIQIRRILKPDGLFLGHMFGAGTLAALKSMMLSADKDAAAPHVHPQIDLRSAADLLARAGFALPVADQDVMRVRYSGWRSIVSDLRDAGLGNALAGKRLYSGKGFTDRLDTQWASRADDQGKVEEYFTHLYLSGWAPSADQPRPAKRGSGQVSLATILPKPTPG